LNTEVSIILKLNFEYFIASREILDKQYKKSISGSMVGIAVFGIALCVAVMIIAISIVTGFKNEIRNKVIGFGSHIQIVNYDSNISYETQPIDNDMEFLPVLRSDKNIKHVQQFATKAGIIKTATDNQGVVLKGVSSDYDWTFFKSNIISGSNFIVNDSIKTNEVMLSKYLATLLKLKTGDDFAMFFVHDPPYMRRFKIKGIFETNLEDFDKMFVICDIKHVQKLNNWDNSQISGYEVLLKDFDQLDEMTEKVRDEVGMPINEDGSSIKVLSIKEKYPQIFDWLNLQNMNVYIFLLILLLVAGFNMVSGLLILILERTNMIGVLKALGTDNFSIRKIFLYESAFLILKGLFWGNLIGIILCFIQMKTGFIKLDQASYYIDHVPVNLNIIHILLLNAGTIATIILMLLIPSLIISSLNPVDSIKYN